MMTSYRKVIEVNIPTRMALRNITPQVNEALRESDIREGLVLINETHDRLVRIFLPCSKLFGRWLEMVSEAE